MGKSSNFLLFNCSLDPSPSSYGPGLWCLVNRPAGSPSSLAKYTCIRVLFALMKMPGLEASRGGPGARRRW